MVHKNLTLNDIYNDELKKLLLKEFNGAAVNSIFKNNDGSYTVFVVYTITPIGKNCAVSVGATEIGVFSNTKTALSWCITDKFKDYNTAREIHDLDTKLTSLSNDIRTRALLADSSTAPQFRENISTKLESKIIRKKFLEQQLEIRIKRAKYLQQRGFNNETERLSPKGNIKTNR